MSVCDCRSLLCSVHYRIVAEHVTQRSGMHVCKFEQLLRSGFAEQEQGHIYRIVSLKLSHCHLCSTDDFATLPSPCDWPPCFSIYKFEVSKLFNYENKSIQDEIPPNFLKKKHEYPLGLEASIAVCHPEIPSSNLP